MIKSLAIEDMIKSDDFQPTDRPTAKKIRRLLEMQKYSCAVTGIELTPEDANLDHIVPIARGGTHVMGNVQVVHRAINHMKSTLTPDEFLQWCRKVVDHANGGAPLQANKQIDE